MRPIRIAITGTRGQLVRCLLELASGTDTEIVTLGRPTLDLRDRQTIETAVTGRNFVRTMLDLARRQPEILVVSDQVGNPTAAVDIASGILKVACNLVTASGESRYGTFHMTGTGSATRAEFAAAIFADSAALGGPTACVVPIPSAEQQTVVQRPKNSRLDCAKIARIHGVKLPSWRSSLGPCVRRILEQDA